MTDPDDCLCPDADTPVCETAETHRKDQPVNEQYTELAAAAQQASGMTPQAWTASLASDDQGVTGARHAFASAVYRAANTDGPASTVEQLRQWQVNAEALMDQVRPELDAAITAARAAVA